MNSITLRVSSLSLLFAVWLVTPAASDDSLRWSALQRQLESYRENLNQVRQAHGGVRELPAVDFFLFGMGPRLKLVYHAGRLTDAQSGKAIREWEVLDQQIVPSEYTVAIKTKGGRIVVVFEDEEGLWIEEQGQRELLAAGRVSLPTFAERRYGPVLRVLHQELLVNVIDGRPVPNFFVYARPWYRDGAMMAMALAKTQNVHLVRDWINGLEAVFDTNNGGESEADNPGQLLYLISLVSDKNHAMVQPACDALKEFENHDHIVGRSDFAEHPVYQTRWAKFGLRSLGLPDRYTVPQGEDSYASLVWWDSPGSHQQQVPVLRSDDYPYLTWAGSHTTGQRLGKLSNRDYPLTWEANASQARYEGMNRITPDYAKQRICAPHTWHAAEAFLYLFDE